MPHSESNAGVGDIPGEALANDPSRAVIFGIEVQSGASALGAVDAVPGDYDVRPLALRKRRLRDFSQAIVELPALRDLAADIPFALIPEDPQPEIRGCVIFGEVDPDA